MRFAVVRRAALAALALLCLAFSLVLALVASDVIRTREAFSVGDVRYRVAPEASDPWHLSTAAPLDLAARVLAVDDDLELRRAVRALRLARLEDATISDPELQLRRNEAQALLERIATGEDDPRRRSRAAGLLGALGLARLVTETQERAALLESTISSLQFALALDPENDEAKYNLELALQRGRGVDLTEGSGGANPSPGGGGAKGAGAGDPGSGY